LIGSKIKNKLTQISGNVNPGLNIGNIKEATPSRIIRYKNNLCGLNLFVRRLNEVNAPIKSLTSNIDGSTKEKTIDERIKYSTGEKP